LDLCATGLSTDSNFRVKVGDHVEITLDTESSRLSALVVSIAQAHEKAWNIRRWAKG
jgi:hypothetical protein